MLCRGGRLTLVKGMRYSDLTGESKAIRPGGLHILGKRGLWISGECA